MCLFLKYVYLVKSINIFIVSIPYGSQNNIFYPSYEGAQYLARDAMHSSSKAVLKL